MSTVKVEIKNMAQIRRAFKQAPQLMARGLNNAIRKSLFEIQAETVLNVHPGRGINIITSGLLGAATRPPRFGNLVGTYEVSVFAPRGGDYAFFVHDGTRYMRGRPFLLNAVESKEEAIQRHFRDETQDVLNEIARATE